MDGTMLGDKTLKVSVAKPKGSGGGGRGGRGGGRGGYGGGYGGGGSNGPVYVYQSTTDGGGLNLGALLPLGALALAIPLGLLALTLPVTTTVVGGRKRR